jgi:multiple sugar transport system permease protein
VNSSQPPRALRPSRLYRGATWTVLLIGAVWVLLPIGWLLYTAFKLPVYGFAFPPKINTPFTLANFRTLFHNGYFTAVVHSLIVTVSCVVASLVLGLPAGYSLSRGNFRGKNLIGIFLLASYAAPAVIFIIPLFFIYTRLNILDTYPGLVLAYLTGLLPFTIWLSRRFFDDLPIELEDAGMIDGCGRTRVFLRIVLPLSLPAVSTIGILVAILTWGEFFGALILTGPNTVTAPVAMGNFISYDTNNWSALAAAGVVVIVPVLIATVVAQRGLLSGLTAGAVRQ